MTIREGFVGPVPDVQIIVPEKRNGFLINFNSIPLFVILSRRRLFGSLRLLVILSQWPLEVLSLLFLLLFPILYSRPRNLFINH